MVAVDRDFELVRVPRIALKLLGEGLRMVAGQKATPGDEKATERLMEYWAHGEGAAKINWGHDGDFDRCRVQLGKYVHNPEQLAGLCSNLHVRATGARPGHAPAELAEKRAKQAGKKAAH